jgi:hypothetical protein
VAPGGLTAVDLAVQAAAWVVERGLRLRLVQAAFLGMGNRVHSLLVLTEWVMCVFLKLLCELKCSYSVGVLLLENAFNSGQPNPSAET